MTAVTTVPQKDLYHFYCPQMDITEAMLDQLITGEAYARLCYSSEEDSEHAAYQLVDWQRQLFEEAKQTGILINPTYEIYLDDALHNVWEAYCSLHRQPLVEVRIEPRLAGGGPLGWQWRTVYTVRFSPPNLLWRVAPEGVDELRLLITLFTDDDPTADGWDPDLLHHSYVNRDGSGELTNLRTTDALPLAKQALTILERFGCEVRHRG